MNSPRHPFLDWDGPLAVRPPRRGQRRAGEHDAGVPVRRRPRLPLPRDRRAGDRRRGARGLPRQRPAAHVRTARQDQRAAVAEVSKALVDGKAPIPLLEDLLGAWPQARINIDCKTDAARRRADRLVAPHQLAGPGVRRGVQRRAVEAAAQGARQPSCAARSAQSSSALLRFGLLRHPPGLAAQVPVKQGPLTVVNQEVRRAIPPSRPAGPRVDDRRRRRDGAPARPRRRRDHDRPPRRPPPGPRIPRSVALLASAAR